MQTSITLNELIKLCKDNGVSLDTPVVVSDIDEWTKILLYEFDIGVRKYTEGQNEIVFPCHNRTYRRIVMWSYCIIFIIMYILGVIISALIVLDLYNNRRAYVDPFNIIFSWFLVAHLYKAYYKQ